MPVITASKDRNDGTAYKLCSMIDTPIHILLISRQEDLNFNEDVLGLRHLPYVVVDFIEEGWDAEIKETLVIGENTHNANFLYGEGWKRLHDFMNAHPPRLYFKRELLKEDDNSDFIWPIEYPSWMPDYQIQTEEEFNNRPINVLNFWGRSHEARLLLHGKIWEHAAKKGYTVCDNLYQFNQFMHYEKDNKNKWLSFHIPFYDRQDIHEIMKINAISKLCISLPGAGIKCFRQSEAPLNSIMVTAEDNLSWTYKWEHGVNCIKFLRNEDVTGLKNEWDIIGACEAALNRNDLYDIYRNGKDTINKYLIGNYVPYLQQIINNV